MVLVTLMRHLMTVSVHLYSIACKFTDIKTSMLCEVDRPKMDDQICPFKLHSLQMVVKHQCFVRQMAAFRHFEAVVCSIPCTSKSKHCLDNPHAEMQKQTQERTVLTPPSLLSLGSG